MRVKSKVTSKASVKVAQRLLASEPDTSLLHSVHSPQTLGLGFDNGRHSRWLVAPTPVLVLHKSARWGARGLASQETCLLPALRGLACHDTCLLHALILHLLLHALRGLACHDTCLPHALILHLLLHALILHLLL